LRRLRFLVPLRGRPPEALEHWAGSMAVAYYDSAVRDLPFETAPRKGVLYLRKRLRARPQPSLYKNYSRKAQVALPPGNPAASVTLSEALAERRTARQFGRAAVPLTAFAAVIRGTWGQTGWLDAGVLGRLIAKTSPSAGARHPIECYVLVWN